MNVWMSCLGLYVCYMYVLMSVRCGLWCPHWSLSLSSLVCVCVCAPFPPTLQEIWMAIGGTMRLGIAVRPPQCLWWDMWSPALTPPSCPLTPISLSLSLSLSSPHPPSSRVFCHFMFPSFYLHLCMLFFCFSFCFLSHTCRGQSKGKKKNYWAGIYARADTHLIWEAKENGALWGTLIWRGLGMVWTAG